MKCSKCGAEIEAGTSFCTLCGTPVAKQQADDEKTVLVNQEMMGQPQGFPTPVQPNFQQQNNTGFNQQGVQPGMPSFGQPNPQMGQQPYGQPNPQMGQQPYGQPNPQMGQQPYGQPNPQMGQQPYGQPMYNQAPRPPKPPRKPLSKKAKIGIISGAIAVVLLIVFFVVILPILTRAKLKGEYTYTDSWDDEYVAIFDDGTYLIYDYEGDLDEAGTYTIKDNKVTLIDIEGYETSAKFDSENNTIKIHGDKYKSTNKKEKIDFTLTENYLETIKPSIEDAIHTILEDKEIYEEVYWSSEDILDNVLKNPSTDFEEQFAELMNYDNDKALQTLIEDGYLNIYIYITYDDEIEISYYVY